jgi:predicted Zn-dependent peptidase
MINKTILDSGIRVITEQIPHAHSVSIGIWVANGSRHEQPLLNGVAHFVEHLMFKGTSRRSALDIAREIDSVGGVLNAFTSREYVCYYAKVLDKFLPRAVDLLTDIFLNSRFDQDEIEKERKVILQEIGMLEDNPDDYIHDLFHQNFWSGHPLGMSILGSEESVNGLTRAAILDYKNDMYRAEDIIIAAAGNVEHKQLLKLLDGLFARIAEGNGRRESPQPTYAKKVDLIDKDLEQVHICLGNKGLAQNHPQRFAAFILNTILGGSMSSRLFQEVREKLGLVYSIYSYMASHSDAGSMVIYAGTSHERCLDVLEITLRELGRLKAEKVMQVELDSAREQLKGNLLLSLESSDNRMSKLAKNEIYFGCYQPLAAIMNGFDQVTIDTLLQLSQELMNDANFTLEMLGKLDGINLTAADIVL